MSRRLSGPAVLALAATLVASLAAVPPAAAQMQVDRAEVAPQVIDVKAKVTDLDSDVTERYSIHPAQHVPLRVGDRVRLQVVGTVIRDGRGVEEVLPAEFDVAAGPWRIDLAPAGRDAVIVVARQPNEMLQGGAREGSRSQVGYRVVGDYEMKDLLRAGRITLDITPAPEAEQPAPSDARWRRASEMADVLSYVLLDEREELPEYYVERIYVNGQRGMQQVAQALARYVVRRGELRGWSDEEVVLHLYRYLLGRRGSDREIFDADPRGVRGNVEMLQNRGYESLIESFVGSPEFRDVHDLAAFQGLEVDPSVERSRHRGPLPEYGTLQDDGGYSGRRTRPRGER